MNLAPDDREALGIAALLIFLGGVGLGYVLHDPPFPVTDRLVLTDGVICIAESDTGPHWLVRADGWCYAEDNPALIGPRK
jgi:hypothetical protein